MERDENECVTPYPLFLFFSTGTLPQKGQEGRKLGLEGENCLTCSFQVL